MHSQGQTVRIPCFYYDATHFSVGFPAPLKALEALLPSSEIQPLRVTPKRGLLHVGVFEYRETDVGPYNEEAVYADARRDGDVTVLEPVRLEKRSEGGRSRTAR